MGAPSPIEGELPGPRVPGLSAQVSEQHVHVSPAKVEQALAAFSRERADVEAAFLALLRAGADRLPLPGQGNTYTRWQVLSAVAAVDLSLVKLFEGHTDALAIMHELGGPAVPPSSSWATWAAESPDARVTATLASESGNVMLSGVKAWCSGASTVSHALLTAWSTNGEPLLVAVSLKHAGVSISHDDWQAVGMAATRSASITFSNVPAVLVGQPGEYLHRAGFWQGGAGIAACWYGAATSLARAVSQRWFGSNDALALAHLGAVDVALAQSGALLRETASWIDAHPDADARLAALRVRASVENAALLTLHHAGRALGATPFCKDAAFARMAADLPVFLRQSHADKDLAAAARCLDREGAAWTL